MDMVKYEPSDIPPELAKEAMQVQNACNLSGVACALGRAMHVLWSMAHKDERGTEWVNQHPVVTLYLNQMCWLNGLRGDGPSHEKWSLVEEAAKQDEAGPGER